MAPTHETTSVEVEPGTLAVIAEAEPDYTLTIRRPSNPGILAAIAMALGGLSSESLRGLPRRLFRGNKYMTGHNSLRLASLNGTTNTSAA